MIIKPLLSQSQQDDINIKVGQRIKSIRKANGLTQTDLGDKLGVTFQQVQKYEKGSNRISAPKLFMCSELFGVSVSWFFQDVEGIS